MSCSACETFGRMPQKCWSRPAGVFSLCASDGIYLYDACFSADYGSTRKCRHGAPNIALPLRSSSPTSPAEIGPPRPPPPMYVCSSLLSCFVGSSLHATFSFRVQTRKSGSFSRRLTTFTTSMLQNSLLQDEPPVSHSAGRLPDFRPLNLRTCRARAPEIRPSCRLSLAYA